MLQLFQMPIPAFSTQKIFWFFCPEPVRSFVVGKIFFKNQKSTVMEKFMLIFHGGIKQDASPEALQTNMGQWLAWVEKLHKEGRYVSGEPLLPGGKLVSGPGTVTDGPYTEGKEVVGGYFVVQAANMDEAVALCTDYPDYAYGGQVQVRQVMKVDM
jgi:hypothetical protein